MFAFKTHTFWILSIIFRAVASTGRAEHRSSFMDVWPRLKLSSVESHFHFSVFLIKQNDNTYYNDTTIDNTNETM